MSFNPCLLDIQCLIDEAGIEKNLDAFLIDLCPNLILWIVVCINSSVHCPLAKPFCTTYFLFEIDFCRGFDFGLAEGQIPATINSSPFNSKFFCQHSISSKRDQNYVSNWNASNKGIHAHRALLLLIYKLLKFICLFKCTNISLPH